MVRDATYLAQLLYNNSVNYTALFANLKAFSQGDGQDCSYIFLVDSFFIDCEPPTSSSAVGCTPLFIHIRNFARARKVCESKCRHRDCCCGCQCSDKTTSAHFIHSTIHSYCQTSCQLCRRTHSACATDCSDVVCLPLIPMVSGYYLIQLLAVMLHGRSL